MAYDYAPFPYVAPPGLNAAEARHPVVIIGAGPVGLALAIDLALRGVKSVVLDDNNVVSLGSRAICWSKRTLEIFDRLGVGDRMLEKGVTWKVGRQFHRDTEIYAFDLLPEQGHKYPAFINLQQYYVEEYLVERAQDFPDLIDLRFLNKVVDHTDHEDYMTLTIQTPNGPYRLEAEWLVACDGAGSATRQRMNLAFEGETFEENFLIVDVEMATSPFGTHDTPERWFWFSPPFHNGQSALLHKQPDNIYRIDLQLGPDTDPHTEATKERVIPRIKAIIGDAPFRLDWQSVYRFRCARLERFVHNRTVFAGDSAHVVSPFGARGGNGGIQDVDNLGWKLAAVCAGKAPANLIDSYDAERGMACDENILNSARATNFMTPKSPMETLFRDEVLSLAAQHPFARALINSGRLSLPFVLSQSALHSSGDSHLPIGSPVLDAPVSSPDGTGWLIDKIPSDFCLLHVGPVPIPAVCDLPRIGVGHQSDYTCFEDPTGLLKQRYGTDDTYLLRPDGHICAAFRTVSEQAVAKAMNKALGNSA
ncbi:FAD-dependent oxidoreductase [Roseobacter litoralis]|uniref:3-(3-hydroxy-phenyl)propionate/3-hydroxycinnamic acid hydroxylase n=1 Tax=Roseobacter litoralis (strain ATCC 49566 / DSM 6996 / JCM 21268 / NBRC 15278 / OCh 149) TaxID=391595 RepID=F7ZA81_ROSLO|nr:FAD-dependent oxidoreductase [Roseobacter litoralis]AEI95428.1 putative 3-(3-hydroxy-phenyl)propionate/3-hydroxycinnamic acid hydroxylase [Roseobacter litoralis Och 149]